jgi:hypothetical protein
MINFYNCYSKTGLDHEEYGPALDQLEQVEYDPAANIKCIEHLITRCARYSISYARFKLNGRFLAGEPVIMVHSYYARLYAKFVIKDRWPEAEPYILQDAADTYWYTRDVVGGWWPEAEPFFKSDDFWWKRYNDILTVLFKYDHLVKDCFL